MSSVIRPTAIGSKALLLAGLLLAITISGCGKRQLVRPTPQMDAESRFWVRVLLLEKSKTCTLESESSFVVLDAKERTVHARFTRTSSPVKIQISRNKITIAEKAFTGDQIIIFPDTPHIFRLNGQAYRGKLKLVLNGTGDSFTACNRVAMEPYLAGVVGAEMPDYWEMEALKAQAIAARTYCLYKKRNNKVNLQWDLKKTQASQVYRGLGAESTRIWDAVTGTHGQVLTVKHEDGSEGVFPAYYSSTCGGHTESSKKVFGDSFESLTGVRCNYCKEVAKPKYFYWPAAQFKKDYVSEKLFKKYPKLKSLKKIVTITPHTKSNHDDFSRITSVKFTGANGKNAFLRAEDLRLTIDPSGRKIRSTMCQIVTTKDSFKFLYGRGWGHGVGLCQCGAQALARRGYSGTQILAHYYPGSKVESIY